MPSLDAFLRSLSPRSNPRRETAEEDLIRWLDASSGPTAKDVARALGTTTARASAMLEALGAARWVRREVAFERNMRRDRWKLRRPGLALRVARVLLGADAMPAPRPFLGDGEAFLLPVRPGIDAGLVTTWTPQGDFTIRGPQKSYLYAVSGNGREIGYYLEAESNNDLAEVVDSYGKRSVAYIQEVGVPYRARGCGRGRALVAEALWQMAERGFAATFLHAFPFNGDEDEVDPNPVTLDDLDDFYRDAGLHFRQCCAGDENPVYWFDFEAMPPGARWASPSPRPL